MPTSKEDLPGTITRSPKKVQRTYAKTLDSAHEQYDSEERAHRTAFASVKHVAERVGDHWELKDEPGPSDPQSSSAAARRATTQEDLRRGRRDGQHKEQLYERAKSSDQGPLEDDQEGLAGAISRRQ